MVCPSRMFIQDDHTKGVKLISVIDIISETNWHLQGNINRSYLSNKDSIAHTLSPLHALNQEG